jgi:muconate cycloisomerase
MQTYANVKITKVETIPLRVPFHSPFKIASGSARPSVEVLLVRLHTNEGIVGVGETQAWRRQGSSETLASLTAVIRDHFSPHIVGQSPFSIAAIMPKLEDAIYHSLYAQAAISDALFDLQGKVLGVPSTRCSAANAATRWRRAPSSRSSPRSPKRSKARQVFRARLPQLHRQDRRGPEGGCAERARDSRALRRRSDHSRRRQCRNGLRRRASLLKKLEPYEIDAAEQAARDLGSQWMAELARRVDIP